MKLSLIFPPWFTEFGDFQAAARKVSCFPPLNLCRIGAIAQKAGWQVQVIDAHVEGLSKEALLERVRDFHPDLIGLTAATPFFANAVELAKILRKDLPVPLIMGGAHVSFYRERAFADCFDHLVIGECETTFGNFLTRFAAGDRCPDVQGIMSRHDGQVFYLGDAPFLDDLDEAPLPDRGLLKNELYLLGTPRGTKRFSSIQMSRGCPFSCVFCASDLHGKRMRYRSISNVMEELESALQQYGAEHIYFNDDVWTLDKDYLFKLCDEIEKRELRFTFEGSSRANLWTENLARRLRSCGLLRVSFGLESADENVRRIIKKDVPLESYLTANRINNRLGIETINSVIIGLPGDTRAGVERTVRYLCSQRDIHHVTLNIAVPYPGTEMLKMAERGDHGLRLIEKDFSKFQRYGSVVMEVNDLTARDLLALQKTALLRIYACWWRWLPVLKRFGIRTVLLTALRVIGSLLKKNMMSATSVLKTILIKRNEP